MNPVGLVVECEGRIKGRIKDTHRNGATGTLTGTDARNDIVVHLAPFMFDRVERSSFRFRPDTKRILDVGLEFRGAHLPPLSIRRWNHRSVAVQRAQLDF